MRTLIVLLCFSAFLISCNDSKKEKNGISIENDSIEHKNDLGSSPQDQPLKTIGETPDNDEKSGEDPKEDSNSTRTISGTYLNSEHQEDTSCKCYCIEVSTSGSSELCLKENEVYIKARFKSDGNNINIFYTGKSPATTAEKIPWDKFDTGTPIAVLSPEPNGDLKLDWKGFRIDGEIAIDYALLGKKTLEGTYKKK